MSVVIKVENLSKQYRLGLVGVNTFKEDLQRKFARLRGKEDPFLQIGTLNDRTIMDSSKFVWSLNNISFDVNQGDVLGIIGSNGAGKSTLLKILSKVTMPTGGSIKAKGRIASLLEVGTGFHPELTGRENIYLNGAILGMRKQEISRKLDEIVDFAGIHKYLDTPVKRYSSGMYVRLAFAVAAHLDSDILIVDEVLAVGDIEFQQKCLGKIGKISSTQGRTVVFVSHFMNHIQKLCNKSLYLNKGELEYYGDVTSAIDLYQTIMSKNNEVFSFVNDNEFICVNKINVFNSKNEMTTFVYVGESWTIEINLNTLVPINGFVCALGITNSLDLPLNNTWTTPINVGVNKYLVRFTNDMIFFGSGEFKIHIGISSFHNNLVTYSNIMKLTVSPVQSKNYTSEIYNLDSKSSLICNQLKNDITKIL
jgi:lipopolysaccharide transport system ATP-binding protein